LIDHLVYSLADIWRRLALPFANAHLPEKIPEGHAEMVCMTA
jgi:hypothetical protein